jgi:hypothetical protein
MMRITAETNPFVAWFVMGSGFISDPPVSIEAELDFGCC